MTDVSLCSVSNVTIESAYRSSRQVRALWPLLTAAMPGRATMGAETSSQKEVDRVRAARMVAAQAGDRAAYEALLRDCIPFIKRVARGQGVRPELIDDVVQETLFTVHQARHTYDPNRSFTAWLRTITQRRAIDGLRRGGRTRTREIYAPLEYENHADPDSDPEEAAIRLDNTEVLKSAVGRLSAGQREAVEHLALAYQSPEQAANITGRSAGSLRVDWHRALKSLRMQFGRRIES